MPNETIMQGLIEEAAKLTHDARSKLAEYEGRDAPADVKAEVDRWLADALEKKAQADGIKRDLDRDKLVGDLHSYFHDPARSFPHAAAPGEGKAQAEMERRAFHEFILKGELSAEYKALSAGTDIEGGYLVPDVFRAEVIQKIEDMFIMRRICRVLPAIPSGASVVVPAADTEMEDASWSTEVATRDEDTTQPFAQRVLRPNPLAKLVKVSNVLLRGSAVSIEAWLRNELAKKHGRAEEQAFMTGHGVNQPLGIFAASALLPSTVTNVTAASTTDIAADDIVKVIGNTRAQYRRAAKWIMHRTILMEISLLKDGNGAYLWQPSLVAGQPDMLRGYPVFESEFAPSSSATGLFVAAFGDFEQAYWIQDAQGFTIQRLTELYAATRQTGFIGEKETDGAVCDGYALTRLVMA